MSRASELEQQMLGLINEERTSRGLNPVELELRLNESSEDHSQWMLEEDQFSHTGENGTSAGDRMRNAGFEFEGAWSQGENIAFQSERGEPGLADDVVDLHNSLMNSPGHRANILNPDYEVIGLGIETGEFDGFEAVMVTQNFATTDAEVQLDQDDPTSPEPEPVPDTPEPEPEPDTPEPEPEPDTPEPEPEPDTPEPEPEPDTPEPEPEPDTPEPEPEPDTPDVVGDGPDSDDGNTFAQLQFFATAFLAALFDEEFTFTWDGGDDGAPQTVTFDVDEFFAGLFEMPEDGDTETGDADVMAMQQDATEDGDTGFNFVDDWDCLA